MIEPAISPVAPRVFSPESGAVLQLTDEVELLLSRRTAVKVRLEGEGNLSALSHLAAVMSDQVASGQLRLEGKTLPLETGDPVVTICADPSSQFLFPPSKQIHKGHFDILLRLASWQRDDFIEYLLAQHPAQCGSVMQRLKRADMHFAGGSPVAWKVILDRMAANESKTDPEAIVLEEIDLRINNASLADAIADRMIFPVEPDQVGVFGHPAVGLGADQDVLFSGSHSAAAEFLLHESVKVPFAMRRLVRRMEVGNANEVGALLRYRMRTNSLVRLAKSIEGDAQIQKKLDQSFKKNQRWQTANSATLLALSDPNWRPSWRRGKDRWRLHGAYFPSVNWRGVNLLGADLRKVCFVEANLVEANLRECQLSMADFSGAQLMHADFHARTNAMLETLFSDAEDDLRPAESESLSDAKTREKRGTGKRKSKYQVRRERKKAAEKPWTKVAFVRVKFQRSNLSNAHLSKCYFMNSDFRGAELRHVEAQDAVFLSTIFDGANLSEGKFQGTGFQDLSFANARIDQCSFCNGFFRQVDFAEAGAATVDFSGAEIAQCTWTGSRFVNCNFSGCDMAGGRMADIQWDFCDLRRANLQGCSFHMGTTRSGMVNSPYPSHGTRTGFYTDDYNDQHFRPPESIRKASLYGCDLRGANLCGVDFYLVDLRAAKFDAHQREQFITTGAILDDDVF